jgi:hypothetical protein
LQEALRSSVEVVIFAGMRVIERFPALSYLVDRFLLGIALESAPLTRKELELVCFRNGLLNGCSQVRTVASEIIYGLSNIVEMAVVGEHVETDAALWISQYSETEKVNLLITELWRDKELRKESIDLIVKEYLSDPSEFIRSLSTRGLIFALLMFISDLEYIQTIFQQLFALYNRSLPVSAIIEVQETPSSKKTISKVKPEIEAKLKAKQPKKSLDELDTRWFIRAAVIQFCALITAHPEFDRDSIIFSALQFLLETGSIDPKPEIRSSAVNAAKGIVEFFGSVHLSSFMNYLEEVLARKPSKHENLTDFDNRYGGTVVLLGTLAQHLDETSSTLTKVLDLLLEALLIPSESVQKAVSNCLTPLASLLKHSEYCEKLVETLIKRMISGSSYGERRGAAYGLGAVVKGVGLSALKRFGVIAKLKECCSRGDISARQGALFGFECLADKLGILFEPYVVIIVDSLLISFSHSSDHVREAAQLATQAIMSKLSPYGVRQLLSPIIVIVKQEASWKSRQEGIKMLSVIIHCAPKQSSANLPEIVGLLVEKSSSDPHPKVKESAKAALQDISSVIKNPEIAGLSSVLLLALADPANRTKEALEALLVCEFMHSMDGPSLALLFPILARALRERGADLKRKASAITGNIISMVTDTTTLIPFIQTVIPGLKDCLIDPIPDVRASGAKALGNLYHGIDQPELNLKDMMTWLLETMKSERSSVERSGAAQGLAEICGLSQDTRRKDSLIKWVEGLRKESSAAREGMMWFFTFLPSTMKEQFSVYLDRCLPLVLFGFSDESESVREVALRAGKAIISVLGIKYCNELASLLITGVFDGDWRVRFNSLQLLGELVFLVGEVKAGMSVLDEGDEDEEGENPGSSKIIFRIRERLGKSLTDEVVSAIYIIRSDVAVAVRQHALLIWKSIISSTPRTLVEVMPTLINLLVSKLCSEEEDLRVIIGRSIGELVSKLGDKVLPIIIQPFQSGLSNPSESTRLGICTGLTEVLNACSKKQIEDYIETIITVVMAALCDDSEEVTQQGARAFMILLKMVGPIAIGEIVPALLKCLKDSSTRTNENDELLSSKALRGLKEIVSLKPREMLDHLFPMLLVSPLTTVSATALTSVIEVSGYCIHYHFHSLVPIIVHELYSSENKLESVSQNKEKLELEMMRMESLKSLARSVVSVTETVGVHQLVLEIGKQIEHDTSLKRRKWGCFIAEMFFTYNKVASYDEYLPLLLKFLLGRITDTDNATLISLKDAVQALAVNVSSEKLLPHIEFLKNCLMSNVSSARHRTGFLNSDLISETGELVLPYFTLPKSLDAFYSMFLFGLTNGSSQVRESAADMIGQLAKLAHNDVLKPTIIKTIGPLIRVIGERHPSNIKAAILTVKL